MTAPVILIVDDDDDLRELITLILESRGFGAIGAIDGLDALEKLAHTQPSLILLDLRMPRMNGSEFLQAVRGTPVSGIPIVALTGDPGACEEAVRAGAVTCLRKPFEPRTLLDTIRTHIGSPSRQPAVDA